MAQFYYEKYVNNYEIDYYNHSTEKERKELVKKFGSNEILYCFYKDGKEWSKRISGMCFNITNSDYYVKLKEHLDHEFKIFMRKEKLKKLNEKF